MNDQRRVLKSCAWVIAYSRDLESIASYGTMCVVSPTAPMEGGSRRIHYQSMFKPADSLGLRKTHFLSMFKPANSLGSRKTHFLSMFQNPETAAQNKFVGAHAIRWSAHKNSMLINASQYPKGAGHCPLSARRHQPATSNPQQPLSTFNLRRPWAKLKQE